VLENIGKETQAFIVMLIIGIAAGLGQLLASDEKITYRLIFGRCISSGILAIASGSVLLWIPNIPDLALFGISAVLASLGTSAIERMAHRYLGGRH